MDQSKKILVIEDDTFFQHFYAQKLAEEGYVVDVANNGEEGMEKMKAIPALVLLDLIMPKKDGFQVLEEKAQDEILRNIPVLVFSTLGEEQDVMKAKNLGAVDYINKSFFDFPNLLLKIQQILSKNQQ